MSKKLLKLLKLSPAFAYMISVAVLAGALTIMSTIAYADFFYVREGASGDGSDWTNAYALLPDTLQRGSTYYIADGHYGSYTFDDPVSGTQYITIKKATASDHGTDTGWSADYGDETAEWQATIMFRTDYITFDGVTGGGYGHWDSGYGFKVSSQDDLIFIMFSDKWGSQASRVNVSHITISHVELAGRAPVSPGWGDGFNATAYLANTSQITISHCYVHDIGGPPFKWMNANGITVDSCFVARNASSADHHGTGFRMDNVSGLILRNSIFEDIVGTGFVGAYDTGVSNVEIYGNVFWWTPAFGGETNAVTPGYGNGVIYSVGASGPVENWKIYNNTFVHLPDRSAVINIFNSAGKNEAYNNLFFNIDGNPTFGGIESHDYNYFSVVGGIPSEVHGQNGGSVNPLMSWQTKDFRLKSSLEPGMILNPLYGTDAQGTSRGVDGVWDRGAYEYCEEEDCINNPPFPSPTPTPSPVSFTILPFKNTFNPTKDLPLEIPYQITGTVTVTATIYDRQGRKVRDLGDEERSNNALVWNGKNEEGKIVSSGVYAIVVKCASSSVRRRVIVLK